MRSITRICVSAALCLSASLLAACSGSPGQGRGSSGAADSTAVVSFASAFDGLEPGSASYRSGKRLYSRYCLVCHGEEGAGDGFNAYNLQSSLDLAPANFADSAFAQGATESSVGASIAEGETESGGGGCLLPWGGTLSSLELKDVAGYVLALGASGDSGE